MKVEVEKLSVEDLNKKIEAIKAEQEKTANTLKRYEEELERRKQEVQLGVPTEGNFCVNFNNKIREFNNKHSVEEMEYNIFNTLESAEKHAEMLLVWRKALVSIAKGEPIDIQVLLPLLRKGWVAMARNKRWYWYSSKPNIDLFLEMWKGGPETYHIGGFNLKPADDWRESLKDCGL